MAGRSAALARLGAGATRCSFCAKPVYAFDQQQKVDQHLWHTECTRFDDQCVLPGNRAHPTLSECRCSRCNFKITSILHARNVLPPSGEFTAARLVCLRQSCRDSGAAAPKVEAKAAQPAPEVKRAPAPKSPASETKRFFVPTLASPPKPPSPTARTPAAPQQQQITSMLRQQPSQWSPELLAEARIQDGLQCSPIAAQQIALILKVSACLLMTECTRIACAHFTFSL